MKKLFLIVAFLCLGVPAFAQDIRPSAYQGQPGKVTVRGGKVLGSTGGVVTIAEQTITPANSATTYIYIDLSSTPAVTTSTSGFPSSSYFPIATAVKDANGIMSLTDSRPDFFMAGGTSSSSSPVNSQFFISNVACGGATNCLQMVDDDSTDNCGAALTTWLGLVNAYAGPGAPQVTIYGSGSGKAYKLATANCELAFTSTKGAMVHNYATIDCAQTGTDCIRLGPTGQVSAVIGEDFVFDGTGVLYGGASLTSSCSPACAGILVEPGVNNFFIDGTQFRGPAGGTTNSGFGANNATLGNCTNYLIYIANPVSDGFVRHVKGGVTSSTSTNGGCGFANPNGAAAGTNTVKFIDNVVGTIGFSGGAGACGSVGILDGGSYGTSGENVIYGFGMPIRVQGQGHIIRHNEIDNAQCAASALTAAINVGAAASSAAIPGLIVDGNIVQGGATHTLDLLAIAGDSTATITGASLVNNQTSGSSTANLFHANLNCTVTTGNYCNISGNVNMTLQFPAGTISTGWANTLGMAGTNSQAALGGNLAFTNLVNVPTSRTYIGWCEVIETTADAVSSTLPSCQFKYTDLVSGALVTRTVSATNTGNTVGTISDGYITLVVAAGGQVQYGTTGYLSNTGGVMKYTVGGFVATY